MNSFYEHHEHSIRFHYRCFDRILLNGLIQPFQQPERVIGFFDAYRRLYPVSRDTLGGTWDLFRYPGVRSDSDLPTYAYAYAFKPWKSRKTFGRSPSPASLRRTGEETAPAQSPPLPKAGEGDHAKHGGGGGEWRRFR